MRKLFTLLIVAVTLAGCAYDDRDLRGRVDDLDSRLEKLEQKVEAMNTSIDVIRTAVEALEGGHQITAVTETSEGITLTLSSGTSLIVKHGANGSDGTNAPVIGVREHTDGVYYWTLTTDETEKWLPDSDVPVLKVTGDKGADGYTPRLGITEEGYWTIDGERIPDGRGGYVKAAGEDGAPGEDGDSFFESVDVGDDSVILKLKSGQELVLPRANSYLVFKETETAALRFSSTKELDYSSSGIDFVEILSVPEGWSASLDTQANTVTVTAPAYGQKEEGLVSLIGLDSKGNAIVAARRVKMVDYTYSEGTFLLNEGTPSSQDGTIIWYDGDLQEFRDIYQEANGGRTPGNVLQDMYISGGKAYIVCQNGSVLGGDGQLLVCDARTMKVEKIYDNLDFKRKVGHKGCPQHIVVVDGKVFIQYVDESLESNSGIRVFDLEDETLREEDIAGTYGAFGTVGALKARMLYSRGQIVAGLAKALVFIDPISETVTKRIDFTGGVKDIVKGADGNLYVAVSGDFETPQGYMAPDPKGAKIYAYTHAGEHVSTTTLEEVTFNTATFYPNIGMSASFTEPYLYFTPDKDMMAMDYLTRFDYSTGEVVKQYVRPQQYSYVYGYTGEHPFKPWLFASGNPNYTWTRLTVFDVSNPSDPQKYMDTNRDYRNYTASPAGVRFTYSFSDEFTGK